MYKMEVQSLIEYDYLLEKSASEKYGEYEGE